MTTNPPTRAQCLAAYKVAPAHLRELAEAHLQQFKPTRPSLSLAFVPDFSRGAFMSKPSSAALAVVPAFRRVPRLRPPAALPADAAAHFARIVASVPAGRFGPPDVPMLAVMAQHCALFDRFVCLTAETDDADALMALAKALGNESRLILAAARALRLTQRARVERDAKTLTQTAGGGIEALLQMAREDRGEH